MWGLFWLPLRGMENAGIEGGWSVWLFYAVPFIVVTPFVLARLRKWSVIGRRLHVTAFATAVSLTFYAEALVYTDVVRAMLLFYLTPYGAHYSQDGY